MKIQTTWHLSAPPEIVWPLLTQSQMEGEFSCLFHLGLPRPTECRLPDGPGRVGATRQCISDQGTVEQVILSWDEPRHLSFQMVKTDLPFKKCVRSIVEDFVLVAERRGDGTTGARVTRTTTLELIGRLQFAKAVLLRVGLKKVHRFVFRNWERICRQSHARA